MKILRGTIFGGISYFLLGWLVYGILLMDFFMSNTNQCANRPVNEMIWWAMLLSNFWVALLLTLILYWSNTVSISEGLRKGAIFGALFTATIDFSFWSMTTMYNSLIPILVEIIVSSVVFALLGMIIILTWGREKRV